ncbi:MAG TPA: sulfite oxidase-like oxidoreductase [Acidimicrobiales bacterium]|jgi:DMSO/TMAO reductase YedYZ molybdopterin-dependent catalytic subunit|nr:sulfite oxidase-like oxidoreductase [Acidimicrobiales bacterium]
MGFFDRNRKELEKRGVDPARLPPGQYFTDRFPVLHAGSVPIYDDLSTWTFRIFGALRSPSVTLSWDELRALPTAEITTDIHCVTKWSKFDTGWRGVPLDEVLKLVDVDPAATHVMWHSEYGFTANVPLDDITGTWDDGSPKAMLAYEFNGEPLEPDHGYPLRSLVPHLYFWKSAKWLRGVELMVGDRPGFWEQNGYHMYGDPFREQRYWGD